MKTIIVVCPTLRIAHYKWRRLANTYFDMWVNIRREPMSLTSITGTKYIFCSENERKKNKLKGFHCDVVSIDEFELSESEEKNECN